MFFSPEKLTAVILRFSAANFNKIYSGRAGCENLRRNSLGKFMPKMKRANGTEDSFTMIPNIIIRSPSFNVYDKAIFACIMSCSPSFPSYEKLMDWCGIKSRSTVVKSLRKLERSNVIQRFKKGKKVIYETQWTSTPNELIGAKPVHYVDSTSTRNGLEPVHDVYANNTNKKYQLKSKSTFENLDQQAGQEKEKIGQLIDAELAKAAKSLAAVEFTEDDMPF